MAHRRPNFSSRKTHQAKPLGYLLHLYMIIVAQLTPSDLQKRVESGELWRILDVREPWEIEIANIAGTMNIPMNEVPARYDELSAEAGIAVLCHSGVRSGRVADWLAANGFEHVANIVGGIDAWSAQLDGSIQRY